jgi:N6-L-threonylcarbamoyladenine synthase
MPKILGIDTSNYTTSVAVVENDCLIYDKRQILNVKLGEKGLRQSEALFQHINNLPVLLNSSFVRDISGVCVSVKPRPIQESYMPVFRAGESIADSISYALGVPVFKTSHQEGHIEAAMRSIDFKYSEFIALHLSGGTSEVLKVEKSNDYEIDILGGTKDISVGQFIDRIGVAIGQEFPAGKFIDEMALNAKSTTIRIPSKVEGYYFNFSGQETQCLKYLNQGYDKEEVAYSAMLCACKTLEKLFLNITKNFNLPIILLGGVASSNFIKAYFKNKFQNILFFSEPLYASDNAVGTAYIGNEKYTKGL